MKVSERTAAVPSSPRLTSSRFSTRRNSSMFCKPNAISGSAAANSR